MASCVPLLVSSDGFKVSSRTSDDFLLLVTILLILLAIEPIRDRGVFLDPLDVLCARFALALDISFVLSLDPLDVLCA